MNIAEAKKIIDQIGKSSIELNDLLEQIHGKCSDEEFAQISHAIGKVLGLFYNDLRLPLYEQHPDLIPNRLKHSVFKNKGFL